MYCNATKRPTRNPTKQPTKNPTDSPVKLVPQSGGDFTLGNENQDGNSVSVEILEGASNDMRGMTRSMEIVTLCSESYYDNGECLEECRETKYFYNGNHALVNKIVGQDYTRACED